MIDNPNNQDLSEISVLNVYGDDNTNSNLSGVEVSKKLKTHFNNFGLTTPAIDFANDYTSDGYDDWFIPTQYEFTYGNLYTFMRYSDKYNSIIGDYFWTVSSNNVSSSDNLNETQYVFNNYVKYSSTNMLNQWKNPFLESGVLLVRKF